MEAILFVGFATSRPLNELSSYARRLSRRTIHSTNNEPAMMPSSQCIWAWAKSLSGAPFTSFTSARLLIAWPRGGVRLVAVDCGFELVVVNAAGFFGDRCEQRVVSFGVRAFQDRARELGCSG